MEDDATGSVLNPGFTRLIMLFNVTPKRGSIIAAIERNEKTKQKQEEERKPKDSLAGT